MSRDFGPIWAVDSKEVAIVIMVIAFVVLIPVLPAGDVGIWVASLFGEQTPKIVYIAFWILFSGVYYLFLERVVAKKWMRIFTRSAQITVFYLQGIIFSFILSYMGIAKLSAFAPAIFLLIFRFLFSPVG